ncbi:MAG TPA: glycosyltransferase, partial [Candidatus Thermoplasmatota archaeon]
MSVVVPVYNPGALLPTCLDSLRRLDYPDLEIVPVDDAGPEPVRGALEAIARDDPRVRPIFHPTN